MPFVDRSIFPVTVVPYGCAFFLFLFRVLLSATTLVVPVVIFFHYPLELIVVLVGIEWRFVVVIGISPIP